MRGKRILVTGCGYKPLKHVFYDIVTGEPTHDAISVNGQEMKLNIGAATAGVLAFHGADVHMVSTSEEKLANICKELGPIVGENRLRYSAMDLLDKREVYEFIAGIPTDKELYWVQSIGIGAGSYHLKDDNPYLPLDEIEEALLEAETIIPLRATHIMMKALLPQLRKQEQSKIAIITSMSAIRGYSLGGTHCTAKAAIDKYANVCMLASYKERIFLTTIRPGGVDTGMYENPTVQEAIKKISDEYKGIYREHFCLAPPTIVGEAIAYAFMTPAHILSIDMIANGQFPNQGS